MLPRRKRRVRLHFFNNAPSIEGFFVGIWADHYVLRVPAILDKPGSSVPLEGPSVRVAKQHCWMEDLL